MTVLIVNLPSISEKMESSSSSCTSTESDSQTTSSDSESQIVFQKKLPKNNTLLNYYKGSSINNVMQKRGEGGFAQT